MAATVAATCLVAMALFAAQASAIYGPAAGGFGADIVSVDNASDEQGNEPTTDADISADGRYVVFQTTATNFFENDGGVVGMHGVQPDEEPTGTLREGGIFRYDRDTGDIQLVADGSETRVDGPDKGTRIFRGAENPSVSADGRYVVFSTAQQLVPQDTNENVDVYVRDMDVPLTANRQDSGAYTLVSAKNGGEEPATYAPRSPPLPGANPGADVWPNTAISANGRYVVFRTTELASDLPDHSAVDTPAGDLFVRDLQAKTTTLVSRNMTTATYTSGDPVGGAVGPASISADGSTVSWVSENTELQTRFLPGEPLVNTLQYYLWRRWEEPKAVTRRITGIADLDDSECHEGEEITQNPVEFGPCYGPLTEPESTKIPISGAAPGLSADGYTVVFLVSTALRPDIAKPASLDIFLTSMRAGVSRKAGTKELTLAATGSSGRALPSIESLALSQDGSTIAFTTLRDSFILAEPAPVGTFRPEPIVRDLYVIHVQERTLERAVVDYEGGEPNESFGLDPTLSEDGSTVAFVSAASNLIFSDANNVSDAFTASLESPAGTSAPPVGVNSTQSGFSLIATASPELGLSIKRAKDGGLIVLVETPAAGKLTARAEGTITTNVGRKKRKKKVLLAHVSGAARAEGTTTLTLHLASKYAKYLRSGDKLKALITVGFAPMLPAERLSAEANAAFAGASAKKSTKATARTKSRKR